MFRQEAIDNQKMKWQGRALLLPGIPVWVVAIASLFFLIIIMTFVISGSYTRRINVTGEISTYPRAASVYSTVQGVVVKKLVSEGQMISVGTPVYYIDVSKSTRSGVVSDNQKKDINDQLLRISKIITRLENNKKNTLGMLEKQKNHYTSAYKQSNDIINQAKEGLRIMKENMDNYRKYQAKGLINKDQLSNQVALYYQQHNNFLSLSGQNEQNSLQLTILESQIQTQSAEFDNKIYQMELQRYELQKELLTIDADGILIVRALINGRVDSLGVTVGQMVNIGDTLLQVIPERIEYHSLVLWVPNDAIPYISIGDRVNIRYEAFPAEKFGQFAGRIFLISRVPASSQEMITYQGAPKAAISSAIPYYKVTVRPEKESIWYGGKNIGLENGMIAESTIFLEKRNIYQWMLSPLFDMKHSVEGPENE